MSELGRFSLKKRTFRTAVALLALGVLVGALATGSAAAISSCQELNQSQTYQLEGDITNGTADTCLEITADDVVLEGNGREVDGVDRTADSAGILVSNSSNVTVRNLGNATGWDFGIVASDSNNVKLTNNTANKNGETTTSDQGAGIVVGESEDTTLTNNTANSNNPNGILLVTRSSNLTDNEANNNGDNGILISGSGNNVTSNTVTGNQTYGIHLLGSNNNKLRENTANLNNEAGIYLAQRSSGNNLTNNVANRNGAFTADGYGIWLDNGSRRNKLIGNEALDNGPRTIEVEGEGSVSEDSVEPSQVEGPQGAGIYLGGAVGSANNNTLIDNEVRDTDVLDTEGGDQHYGIWLSQASENELIGNTANANLRYGIWLSSGSLTNELIDNVAEDNRERITGISDGGGSAGIYLSGASETTGATLLANNTARGSEYGIWIHNSFSNAMRGNLVENNSVGIELNVNLTGVLTTESETVGPQDIEDTGNVFLDDTSRNNDVWDFVSETPAQITTAKGTKVNASDVPVTNLSIGSSTKPDTTLSFEANNVSLRAAENPESDPAGLSSIGRYFEANRTEETTDQSLTVAVSYEDSDVPVANESNLELRRYSETQGAWQKVSGSTVGTGKNTVSAANITKFSEFGVFAQGSPVCEGFTSPLISSFSAPPTNTGELNATLCEDLSGNGDGLGPSQTVRVFGAIIRDQQGFNNGLTDEQARVLNWNSGSPETEVTPADMVSLFGQQIRA